MLIRVTGSGFVKTGSVTDGHPVEFRHWQDVVNEAEDFLESAVSSEEEEAVVELWLEDPMSFQTEDVAAPTIRRTGGMIRRADQFGSKQAVTRDGGWDQEFTDAQEHARRVLGNLGNGR